MTGERICLAVFRVLPRRSGGAFAHLHGSRGADRRRRGAMPTSWWAGTRRVVAALILGVSALTLGITSTPARATLSATDPCSFANVNPIPCENSQPGTSPSVSQVQGGD